MLNYLFVRVFYKYLLFRSVTFSDSVYFLFRVKFVEHTSIFGAPNSRLFHMEAPDLKAKGQGLRPPPFWL